MATIFNCLSRTNEDVSLYNKDFFNIVFTGNIGEAQGIDLAIEAANILKNEKICWHFVGDGRNRKKLEKMVKEYNIDERVIFHGFHPEKEIPKIFKRC